MRFRITVTVLSLVLMESVCQAQSPPAADKQPVISPGGSPAATPQTEQIPQQAVAKPAIPQLAVPQLAVPDQAAAEQAGLAPAGLAPAMFENLLYSVRYVPAEQLARSLNKLFEGQADVRVAADVENQLLVLRVSVAGKAGVLELLRQLDRQPRMADLVLLLLRADKEIDEPEKLSGPLPQVLTTIQHLEAGGQVYVSRRLELTTLENQKSQLQFGQTKPVLTGSNVGGFGGGRANSYREQSFGTMLKVTHRATDATHWVADIDLEISELEEPRPVQENEAPVPQGVSTFTYQSTLELQDGQAHLIQRSRSHSVGESDAVTYLVIGSVTHAPGTQGDMQVRVLSKSPVPAPQRVVQVAPPRDAVPPANAVEVAGTEPASEQAKVAKEDVRSSSAADRDRFAGAVRGYISRYDRDMSGFLEKEEWNTIQGLPAEVDADGDQRISREELLAWLSSRLDDPPSPVDANVQRGSLAEYTLRRYDANASGALERAEWAAMVSDPSAADTNQDAVISREELIVWMNSRFRAAAPPDGEDASGEANGARRSRSGLSDEQFQRFAQAMILRYDRNGDQKLDATEQASMSRPPAGADIDGDGFVTSEEMAGWLRKQ